MARKTKVDFTGVESYNIPEEGKKQVRILKVEEATSQGGNDVLKFTFEVIKGDDKGCRVIESFSLADNALWKLKSLLQALGMKCDKKVTLDLDKLEGKELVIEVKHEEYNGTTRAKSNAFFKVGSLNEDEDDDSDEDSEEDDDEDEEEEEEEKPVKKSKKEDKKPSKKSKKPEPEDEDEDEEDWEDEDDEEEEKPVKPSKKSKKEDKKADKKSSKKSKRVEEDEDEDDEDDWEDD